MSLRVILDNIARGDHYHSTDEIMSDADLIWSNCATFNGATSQLTA